MGGKETFVSRGGATAPFEQCPKHAVVNADCIVTY
jgi:hypothetical protein